MQSISIIALSILVSLAFPHQGEAADVRTPTEIIAQAPQTDWSDIPTDQLLIMTLANANKVIIQLAPAFAPTHVHNVQLLAAAHWWDDGEITRVQDNYVVQWAGHDEKAPLPSTFVKKLPAEYESVETAARFRPLNVKDAYAQQVGFTLDGWPVASDGAHVWLTHCYGMVGVARDMPPDTGDGQELYAINGEAPRQLDRNLAVVGRVVQGMEHLSSLPRGTGDLGFYADKSQNVPIQSIVNASELPAALRPHLQFLRPDSYSFRTYETARSSRTDPFFVQPAQGAALCNIPVPVRER